jgi:hypothetical protein
MPVLPELPASVALGMPSRDWYAGPYLADLPQAPAGHVAELTPELRGLRAAHVTNAQGGMVRGARGVALRVLIRARTHRLLAGLVRAVPHHWQRRVKNWLLE